MEIRSPQYRRSPRKWKIFTAPSYKTETQFVAPKDKPLLYINLLKNGSTPPPPTPTIFNNIVLSLLNLQILDGLQPSIIYCQLGSIDKKLHAKKTVTLSNFWRLSLRGWGREGTEIFFSDNNVERSSKNLWKMIAICWCKIYYNNVKRTCIFHLILAGILTILISGELQMFDWHYLNNYKILWLQVFNFFHMKIIRGCTNRFDH